MSLEKEVADGLEQKKSLELQADWEGAARACF